MKRIIVSIALGLACSAVQATLFTDNFARANTAFETNTTTSIGSGYELTQTAGDRFASIRILSGQLQMQQITPAGSSVNSANVVFRQTGIELQNSNVGDSFTVSGSIKSYNGIAPALLYGLAFNYQSDGSFYAARITTGTNNAVAVLQFVRVDSSGVASSIKNVANSTALAVNSVYSLSVSSSAAGVFSYTLDGANLDGGQLTGTATDTVLKLVNGQAGFYASAPNTNPLFDNLSIETIPEPATLGLVGLTAVILIGARRFMI